MNEKEIIAGNKLIAEFMGAKIYPMKGYPDTVQFLQGSEFEWSKDYYRNVPESNYYNCTYKELRYYTSWDWLMPVVEKIEKISNEEITKVYISIEGTQCRIATYYDIFRNATQIKKFRHVVAASTKLESVWQAVVAFIKWYNDQNINNG